WTLLAPFGQRDETQQPTNEFSASACDHDAEEHEPRKMERTIAAEDIPLDVGKIELWGTGRHLRRLTGFPDPASVLFPGFATSAGIHVATGPDAAVCAES